MAKKVDLRMSEWREAIVKVANAIGETELTTRALSLLIADISGVKKTQVRAVLESIPKLKEHFLK